MIDLSKHPVLQELYNLSEGIESLGSCDQLTRLSVHAKDILNTVNVLVLENEAIRRREIRNLPKKKRHETKSPVPCSSKEVR